VCLFLNRKNNMNLQSVLTAAISLSGFYQNAKASNLNITISQPGVPFAPRPLPKADFDTDRDQIIFDQISQLTRDTKWKLADKIPFEGDTFEPEGLVRIGNDRYIVSAAEYTKRTEKYPDGIIINGTDRTAGEGFAHMIVFDGKGKRIADATVSKAGSDEVSCPFSYEPCDVGGAYHHRSITTAALTMMGNTYGQRCPSIDQTQLRPWLR